MEQIIKLKNIFTSDLYARSRASELRARVLDDVNIVILDFDGVKFMSRSFTDEICNIMDDMKNKEFIFVNQNKDIMAMTTKVKEGRNRERIRGIDNARILEFNDMDSLSKYLQTI